SDPGKLLRDLRPELRPGVYAFCPWPLDQPLGDLPAIGTLREPEGLTVIIEESVATTYRLAPLYRAAWIMLGVHSDLQAVGLLAAVTRALADARISVNVISAAYHDHLFVPVELGAEALAALRWLSQNA
ncbi:MAG TPA: ACT domain-containing protein, partial [Gemmataceae bacterium]|nr:ACT domain-containing protein [Gemmataceae bacterium]